jgi:hypothetical protein
MARKSTAALSVARRIVPGDRLPAPPELSSDERGLWEKVVDSKPAEWFAEDSRPVLTEYVRAAVMCDRLAGLIDRAIDEGSDGVGDLLLARDRESRRLANLATKLRLTQQSRYTPQSAATVDRRVQGARPWQSAS